MEGEEGAEGGEDGGAKDEGAGDDTLFHGQLAAIFLSVRRASSVTPLVILQPALFLL
jgi:hypothetical protein